MDKQQHPDAATWEALALGEVAGPERDAWFDHITMCEPCTQVWRGVTMLKNDAQLAGLVPPGATAGKSWLRSPLVQLAVAATLVVVIGGVVLMRRADDKPVVFRSSDSIAVETLTTAVGSDGAQTFSWSPIATATSYRISVFSEDGMPVWSQEVAAPPVGWAERPRTPASYKWRVEALAAGAVVARSRLADLVVP